VSSSARESKAELVNIVKIQTSWLSFFSGLTIESNRKRINFPELQKARRVSGKAAKPRHLKRTLCVTEQRSTKIARSSNLKEESEVAWVFAGEGEGGGG